MMRYTDLTVADTYYYEPYNSRWRNPEDRDLDLSEGGHKIRLLSLDRYVMLGDNFDRPEPSPTGRWLRAEIQLSEPDTVREQFVNIAHIRDRYDRAIRDGRLARELAESIKQRRAKIEADRHALTQHVRRLASECGLVLGESFTALGEPYFAVREQELNVFLSELKKLKYEIAKEGGSGNGE